MKNLKRSFAVVCDRPGPTPDDHVRAGGAHVARGEFGLAVDACDRALAVVPNHIEARFNRAYALAALGRHAEAVNGYLQLVSEAGRYPWLPLNLGASLVQLGRLEDAAKAFEWATFTRPGDPLAHGNLGAVLGRLMRLDEAEAHLRRAVELAPKDLPTRLNLVRALQRAHRIEAVGEAEVAVRLAPESGDAWRTLADVRTAFGWAKEALSDYDRAHALDPESTLRDMNCFGLALGAVGRHDDAIAFYDRYLVAQPADADAWGCLAVTHATTGHLDDALACFNRALELEPSLPAVHSNRLVIMSYGADATPAVMLAEARDWAARNVPHKPLFPAHSPRQHGRLRVGYVSGDFRVHPVGRFVAQIFANHDRERFEVFAYSNFWAEDDVTDEVRRGVDHWRNVCGLSDERLAELVREDEIDLLIDLTGHTPMHRLTAFGRRLAPVQATWLGYFGTTGLDEMDFILADEVLIPPSEERFYTERPARVHGGLYYIQKPSLPIQPSLLPALSNGRVTFGCFNMTTKITAESIALWSKVLRALPDARMILNPHGINTPRTHARFLETFAAHGIAGDRIEFRSTRGREAYFEAFHEVDIMLDTIPFGGGTTTSEALWMGVPVVSLSSDRFPGRMSESILRTVGLPEMIPSDGEAYVRLAVDLAGDLPRLAELRRSLRQQVEGSRLCDVHAYTREIEKTLEWMWAERTRSV